MANQHDQLLICRTLDGNPEAFGELIQKYQDRLFNGMVQIVRSETEAEDIVQDACVLAFRKLETFQGKSAFFTWLYRISYNVAVSRMRRRKSTVSLDGEAEVDRFQLSDDGPRPGDRLELEEQLTQLHLAMGQLSEEHRSILVLREMQEMDYEAISEILDLPLGTVRSRLHRARSQLREHLEIIMNSRNLQ